jgi:hypothetical protein
MNKIVFDVTNGLAFVVSGVQFASWSQSYDFWIYSYNASIVVG